MENRTILSHLEKMDQALLNKIWADDSWATMLVQMAMALGAIFALVMVARTCYKSLTGREPFDFLSIGRPVLFALILSNWFLVTQTIFGITRPLEALFKDAYASRVDIVDRLREERTEKTLELRRKREEMESELAVSELLSTTNPNSAQITENPDKAQEEGADSHVGEFFDRIFSLDNLTTSAIIRDAQMSDVINGIIFWIGELFWESAIYFVFLAKYIFLAVLVLFGPIMMAASILPVWNSAWKDWVERAVSVSLYGAVGYFCMMGALLLIQYAIQSDINMMNEILSTDETFMAWLKFSANGVLGTTSMYFMALFAGACLMLTVPELVTWVFPSQKVHNAYSFITGVQNSIKETVVTAAKIVVVAATGGAAAGAAGGGAGGGIGGGSGGGGASAAGSAGEVTAGSGNPGPAPDGGQGGLGGVDGLGGVAADGGGSLGGFLDGESPSSQHASGSHDLGGSAGQSFSDENEEWTSQAPYWREELDKVQQLLATFEDAERAGQLEALLSEMAGDKKYQSGAGFVKRPLIEKMERCFIDARHNPEERRQLLEELEQLLADYESAKNAVSTPTSDNDESAEECLHEIVDKTDVQGDSCSTAKNGAKGSKRSLTGTNRKVGLQQELDEMLSRFKDRYGEK